MAKDWDAQPDGKIWQSLGLLNFSGVVWFSWFRNQRIWGKLSSFYSLAILGVCLHSELPYLSIYSIIFDFQTQVGLHVRAFRVLIMKVITILIFIIKILPYPAFNYYLVCRSFSFKVWYEVWSTMYTQAWIYITQIYTLLEHYT